MKIRIVCIGKVQDKWLREGIEHYRKRLQHFAAVEIESLTDSPDTIPLERQLAQEAERMLARIRPRDYVIALDLNGRELTSEEFATALQQGLEAGGASVTILIAGSNGYDPGLLKRADLRVSIGRWTFPHQIARLLLMEQLFRAFKILRGDTYHK